MIFRTITPIIALIIAIGLFFTFTQPTFLDLRVVQDEMSEYAEAIDRAEELRNRVQELIAEQNRLLPRDLERLEAFLPSTIDEVSLLVDIDALAEARGIKLDSIAVSGNNQGGVAQDRSNSRRELVTEPLPDNSSAGVGAVGEIAAEHFNTVDIKLNVTGTYAQFRDFLSDLEKSLVLMEVTNITFTAPSSIVEDLANDLERNFDITVRVYALKPII